MDDLFLILIWTISVGAVLMLAGLVADWLDQWQHWDDIKDDWEDR